MIICIEIPDYDGQAFEVTRDNDSNLLSICFDMSLQVVEEAMA